MNGMSEAIIVALITGTCAIIAQLVISRSSSEKLITTLDKQSEISDEKIHGEIDVIKAQIKSLSDKVDAHNRMVERTYKLEQQAAVAEEQIKVANHRIEDLERKGA